jgi:hypothetical protein
VPGRPVCNWDCGQLIEAEALRSRLYGPHWSDGKLGIGRARPRQDSLARRNIPNIDADLLDHAGRFQSKGNRWLAGGIRADPHQMVGEIDSDRLHADKDLVCARYRFRSFL